MARNRRRPPSRKGRRDRPLRLEALEARHLLSGDPVLVRGINTATASPVDVAPVEIVDIGPFFVFSGNSPEFGRELWRSDGTTEGTKPVADIAAGSSNSRDF